MHVIPTEAEDTQQDVVPRVIQIATPWTISGWLESKLANGKPFVAKAEMNAHFIDLKFIENEREQLTALVARYPSLGASGA